MALVALRLECVVLGLALLESQLEAVPRSGAAAAWRSAALVLEQEKFP